MHWRRKWRSKKRNTDLVIMLLMLTLTSIAMVTLCVFIHK